MASVSLAVRWKQTLLSSEPTVVTAELINMKIGLMEFRTQGTGADGLSGWNYHPGENALGGVSEVREFLVPQRPSPLVTLHLHSRHASDSLLIQSEELWSSGIQRNFHWQISLISTILYNFFVRQGTSNLLPQNRRLCLFAFMGCFFHFLLWNFQISFKSVLHEYYSMASIVCLWVYKLCMFEKQCVLSYFINMETMKLNELFLWGRQSYIWKVQLDKRLDLGQMGLISINTI